MKKDRETLGFHSISVYRNELFAFSIISIILFHFVDDFLDSTAATGIAIMPANMFADIISSIGVEIFVLLSGLGLYFSFRKNSDVQRFYKKRFIRILVPYGIFGCVAWLVLTVISKKDFWYYIYNFSLMSFWNSGNVMLWYIAFILVMYLAFPLIFAIINSEHSGRNTLITLAIMYLILFACENNSTSIYSDVEIALWRMPVFVVGTYFGKLAYEKRQFKISDYVFFIAVFAQKFLFLFLEIFSDGEGAANPFNVIYDFTHKYFRMFSGLYSLGLIFILVVIFRFFNSGIVSKISLPISKITLELYITHVTIRNISRALNLPIGKFWFFLIYLSLSIIVTILINVVSNIIIQRINNGSKQKLRHCR